MSEFKRLEKEFPGTKVQLGPSATDDLLATVDAISSCHITGVTFHLYRALPTHYLLIVHKTGSKPQTFTQNFIFHCGEDLMRFIPVDRTRLMTQFYDFHLLVTLVSNDNWKTFKEERYSFNMLPGYLRVKNLYPKASPAYGDKSTADMELLCNDGEPIPVHSSVLVPKWPYFNVVKKASGLSTIKMPYDRVWVEAMIKTLYGVQDAIDLDTAVQLVILATKYKLPQVVDIATRTIYGVEINAGQAVDMWRTVRKSSEELAWYCVTTIKTCPRSNMGDYDVKFENFTKTATFEEQMALATQFNPQVDVPRIAFASSMGS